MAADAASRSDARLSLAGIVKGFGANRVLRGIDLDLKPGEVLALMGANGAGKSTLVKIVGGVHAPDAGQMRLNGAPYRPAGPSAAIRAGVVTVHQSINDGVILPMSVAENLVIDRLCAGKDGLMAPFGRIKRRAREVADGLGLDLPLDKTVADLSLADRQTVAIARALAHDPGVLILDEPTSALSAAEAERLFETVLGLRARGVAVLYISHRLGDIRRVADRIVALRDGAVTGDFRPPLDFEGALHAMLGQAFDARTHAERGPGAPVVTLKGLQATPDAPPLDLALHAGEVTALVGLIGAGKSEIAECLFGRRRPEAGTMTLDGAPYTPRSPGDAIGRGVFMAAEDRANDSLVPTFDLAQNVSLPFVRRFSRLGFLSTAGERANARARVEDLGVVCTAETDPIEALSGGNQQKIVLGRWLSRPCRLLILDEPFQGVDIKARRDIGRTLRDTAADRATLLLLADLDEALEVADRVLVIGGGKIKGEHRVGRLDRDAVVRQMAGQTASGETSRGV